MGRPGRPVLLDGSKLKNEPMREGDGRVGTWTSEDLMRMDARFYRQLERAIANGEERPVRDITRANAAAHR
jgi:hypothetical protein